ncbi:hypothetical protein ACH419_13535 [Streptomyces bobili]|uniref:hypothetical protein n=1 Tax=Streptomyces bobili TaxID=67280 RepID=UPI0037A92B28
MEMPDGMALGCAADRRQDLGQPASRFLVRARRSRPDNFETADDPAAASLPPGDLGL